MLRNSSAFDFHSRVAVVEDIVDIIVQDRIFNLEIIPSNIPEAPWNYGRTALRELDRPWE